MKLTKPKKCHMCGGAVLPNGTCASCRAVVDYGYGRNRKEIKISVEGTNHEEVSKVMRELSKDNKRHRLLFLITHWSFWFGSLLSILGVVLVLIGANGNTELSFFGQSFKSENIGIASLFIGAVLVVLNVRRLLLSYEKSNKT